MKSFVIRGAEAKALAELIMLLLKTTHGPPWTTQLGTVLLHPNLFKDSLFPPSQEVPSSLKSFLATFSHPFS